MDGKNSIVETNLKELSPFMFSVERKRGKIIPPI
jgi:hypothetical protein